MAKSGQILAQKAPKVSYSSPKSDFHDVTSTIFMAFYANILFLTAYWHLGVGVGKPSTIGRHEIQKNSLFSEIATSGHANFTKFCRISNIDVINPENIRSIS